MFSTNKGKFTYILKLWHDKYSKLFLFKKGISIQFYINTQNRNIEFDIWDCWVGFWEELQGIWFDSTRVYCVFSTAKYHGIKISECWIFFRQYSLVFLIFFHTFGFCRSCDFNDGKYSPRGRIGLNFYNSTLVYTLFLRIIHW